jgi:8-oxo-dGTP diphosphatase
METIQVRKPEAAVAIVCAEKPQESILLMRRSQRTDDPWSGHWSLPGGRCGPQDRSLLQTALRELAEECGIRLEEAHRRDELSPLIARRSNGPFMLVAPFVFAVDRQLPTVVDQREAVETVWLPRSTLCDPARHALLPIPGHPPNVLYPGIAMNGIPLWGFTYRLLADWLGLTPAAARETVRMARLLLDFLQSRGLALKSDWARQTQPTGDKPLHLAEVRGVVPVEDVLAQFSVPGLRAGCFPAASMLEVSPERVCLTGLDFEEYVITAHPR